MFKSQPVLMCGTILAWAWMIRSLVIQLPVWWHSIGAYLVRHLGREAMPKTSQDKPLSAFVIANCEADWAEGKYDNWKAKPKPPIGGAK